MKHKVRVVDVGVMAYGEALELQKQMLELRQLGKIEDTILFVEHPKVITKGIRALEENIVLSEEILQKRGVEVFDVRRGGDVTYHGPGQVVGYFIVHIKELGLGVKEFVTKIEELIIDVLRSEYRIDADRMDGHTGVWIDDEKITAIGVEVKRWVTMHGFAFNINTDLVDFQMIVPCGITDKGVTSLQKLLQKEIPLPNIHKNLIKSLEYVFPFDVTVLQKEDLLREIKQALTIVVE